MFLLYRVLQPFVNSASSERLADGEHTLAVFLIDDQRYAEAEPVLRRALQRREACLGPDHPETLSTTECLAILLQQTGRMQESQPYVARVQAAQQRALFG
eukprot:TRINITY_DN11218_c0_g1_i2.p1 TRINITY_DN11218_c0_g1~~TRINITY_DN11218_c0_g1_i2.p1  ORF type:complete len:100 (+),score=11.42 TRINITY_DN11218_c0_g1_i2:223-522(+)